MTPDARDFLIARQRAALLAVLPILERGNASYHAMQTCQVRKVRADCPTLGPLAAQVRKALGMTTGKESPCTPTA